MIIKQIISGFESIINKFKRIFHLRDKNEHKPQNIEVWVKECLRKGYSYKQIKETIEEIKDKNLRRKAYEILSQSRLLEETTESLFPTFKDFKRIFAYIPNLIKIKPLLFLIILILIVSLISYLYPEEDYYYSSPSYYNCGNGVCDSSETYTSCSQDCPNEGDSEKLLEKREELNVCGDGQCTLTEDCNTCSQDCACGSDETCSSYGSCEKSVVCGDEICSSNEICCEDCKCGSGETCNKITHTCQSSIVVAEDVIQVAVKNYLTQNQIEGKITEIRDTYYGKKSIKQVTIDCSEEGTLYPCQVILFIDESGSIIEEMRTT